MWKGKAPQPEQHRPGLNEEWSGYDSASDSWSDTNGFLPLIPPASPPVAASAQVDSLSDSLWSSASDGSVEDNTTTAVFISDGPVPPTTPPMTPTSSFDFLNRVFVCGQVIRDVELDCPRFSTASTARSNFMDAWKLGLERKLQDWPGSNQVLFDPPRQTLDLGLVQVSSTYHVDRLRVPRAVLDEEDAIPLTVEASNSDRGVTTHDVLDVLRGILYVERKWEMRWDDEYNEMRWIPCVAYVLDHEWPVIHSFQVITSITEILDNGNVKDRIERCRVMCYWMDVADQQHTSVSAQMRLIGNEGSSTDSKCLPNLPPQIM